MNDTRDTLKYSLTPLLSKEMIDAVLLPLLEKRTRDARHISPHYETLWNDIHTLYHAGGKRLRSYITLVSFGAYSDEPMATILPAAAAQELLHMAMLIHDDIIDRDDLRYGVKNIASRYTDRYKKVIADETDRRHYADSAAMLAGDLLISEAFILTSESDIETRAIIAAQRLLSTTIFQVVGGELLDTEAAFRGSDAASPLTIALQKTASYSFVSPLLMGATLASAPNTELILLQKFGEKLGTAYQLRDDLIGVFGDQATTGKSNDSDLLEGKRTLLIELFHSHANDTDRAIFSSLFGRKDLNSDELMTLKELLERSGAKAGVEARIETYRTESHTILDTLDIDTQHNEALSALVELCLRRSK
jgi:geranylgeranyl pyrophosphate synthase